MEQLRHFIFQQDGKLNRAYDLSWYEQSRGYIRISSALAGILLLGFIPVDAVLLEEEAANFLFWARLLFMIPGAFFIIYMTYQDYSSYQVFGAIAAVYTVGAIAFSTAGALSGESGALYILTAQLQCLTFLFVLTRLPWRLALFSGVVVCSSFVFVLFTVWNLSLPQNISFMSVMVANAPIIALSTFFRDRQAISLFEAEQALHIAQEEKNNWSKTFTRFLKHELSNQIAGISLSLQMLERTAKLEGNTYIQRGQQSVVELQELLNRAVEAVTIDDIVADATREELSLDNLIDDLLFEYNLKAGDTRVVAPAVSPERAAMSAVLGNALQLKQLLRNLIDNGIRHASNGSVVEVATPEPGVITVKNRGEPLPENPEKLFELWHSGSGNSGLFGMGLYLARKIALAHGGELTASRPEDGQGAVFRLQLPGEH